MSVNIGTSTSQYATANPFQRKLLKSSNGTLVLFAKVGTWIKYQTSADGITWSGWITVVDIGYDTLAKHSFDVYIDTTDDIYIVYYAGKFRKLTYSGGTWSIGSEIVIHSAGRDCPVITKRSNGDIWMVDFASYFMYAYYSTDGGANWNNISAKNIAYTGFGISIIPYDTKIWAFVNNSVGDFTLYKYDSSWDAGTLITTVPTSDYKAFSVLKITDSNIWVVVKSASGLKAFNWNGSSWDSGTLISNNANDESPTLVNVSGNPAVIWSDYNGSQYDIVYSLYNGASWEAQVNITTDATVDSYPSVLETDVNLNVIWTSGSGSPYTIYFNTTAITTESVYDIDNDFRTLKLWSLDNINNDIRTISNIVWSHINNDFRLTGISFADISNDFRSLPSNVQRYYINNHFQTRLEALYEFNNKMNMVKLELYDIDNKFNLVKEIKSDLRNLVMFYNQTKTNVNNEIRTQKLVKNNISNDFRLIADWMIAGDHGFQSLGKEYIKLYINSIEQTDVDVDSITISKGLNTMATLNFKLGRAYDNTKPDMEAIVEVKYNDIRIYKGYVTNITPTDSPESINIVCQDKYWKDNKTKSDFYVGHHSGTQIKTYYHTIQEAVINEMDWSDFPVGDIIPQTMEMTFISKSEVLNELVEQCGNYFWYYDENEVKQLWVGGKGNIVKIEPQSLGKNINLHNIISSSFTESVEGIINKLKVQMGDRILSSSNSYEEKEEEEDSYDVSEYHSHVKPTWRSEDEVLARDSEDGYGWDYHTKEDEYMYRDIFVRYDLPDLNLELESWEDTKPPRVSMTLGGYDFFDDVEYKTSGYDEDYLPDSSRGFTIDYRQGILIFNEPLFLYTKNILGEIDRIKAPRIYVSLWKRTKLLDETDPSVDEPDSESTNPLLFVTQKVGDYLDEIIEKINYSDLNIKGSSVIIQENRTIVNLGYDDTPFARELAYWSLSNTSFIKISGTISITLDAFLFYGIDLSKRIYIEGVTEIAMNIVGIDIDINTFKVNIKLQKYLPFKRIESFRDRGES